MAAAFCWRVASGPKPKPGNMYSPELCPSDEFIAAITGASLEISLMPAVPSGSRSWAINDHRNIAMPPSIPASRIRFAIHPPVLGEDYAPGCSDCQLLVSGAAQTKTTAATQYVNSFLLLFPIATTNAVCQGGF